MERAREGRMRAPTLTFKRAQALRRVMTLPEVLLWKALRGGQIGNLRFRRQHPIGPYILDFYCTSARLAIEVDGSGHDHLASAIHDTRRDAWLRAQGIKTLRFPARDILSDDSLRNTLTMIAASAAAPSTAFGGPPPPAPRGRIMKES